MLTNLDRVFQYKTEQDKQKKTHLKKVLALSKRKPSLIETDDSKEFEKKTFNNFVELKESRRYDRFNSIALTFAERFNRTIRHFLKVVVSGRKNSSRIDDVD